MDIVEDLAGGLPCTEEFITELFYRVDTIAGGLPRHPQSLLWPGEVLTLALLFALKGGSERAFYR